METTVETRQYLPEATVIGDLTFDDRHFEVIDRNGTAQLIIVFNDADQIKGSRALGDSLTKEETQQLRDELNKILNETATHSINLSLDQANDEIKKLEAELKIKQDMLDAAINEKSTAVLQARREREQQFVQEVMEYHDGCAAGKRDFLEHIGLEWPTITITYTITVEGPQLDDNEDYRYSDDLQRAADEVGYYWEGASVVNRDWEYS